MTIEKRDIEKTVSEFICKQFLFSETRVIDKEKSLLGEGVVDSTGVLELITFLESNYKVKFQDDELVADNFDSIEKIERFLLRKTSVQ